MAEVLVTIGIIGLLAAVLLPSINSNVVKKQYATALRSISTNISDKIQAQMALEDVGEVGDLKAFVNNTDVSGFRKDFAKIIDMRPAPDNLTFKTLNGKPATDLAWASNTWSADILGVMKNGGILMIGNYSQNGTSNTAIATIQANGGAMYRNYATMFIDVNGYKKPNIIGRDIFRFELGQDGTLYPMGGKDSSIFSGFTDSAWRTTNSWHGCKDKSSYGLGCAGRIRESNWVMNY